MQEILTNRHLYHSPTLNSDSTLNECKCKLLGRSTQKKGQQPLVEVLPPLCNLETSGSDPLRAVDLRYVSELCAEMVDAVQTGRPVLVLTAASAQRLRGIVDMLVPLLGGNGVRVIRIGSPDGNVIDIRMLCRLVLATDPEADVRDPAATFFRILTRRAGWETRGLLVVEDAQNLAYDSFQHLQQIMSAVNAGARPLQVLLVGTPQIWEKLPVSGTFAADAITAPVVHEVCEGAGVQRLALMDDNRLQSGFDSIAERLAGRMRSAPSYSSDPGAGTVRARARKIVSGIAFACVAVACGATLLRVPLPGLGAWPEPSRAVAASAVVASAPVPPTPPVKAVPTVPALPPSPPPLQVAAAAPVAPPPAPKISGVTVAPQPAPAASTAILASLLDRADSLMDLGDVATARLVYQRAASLGSARAATTVGRTFDPQVLARLGVHGVVADPATAAAWYRRGLALGDPDAARLLAATSQ